MPIKKEPVLLKLSSNKLPPVVSGLLIIVLLLLLQIGILYVEKLKIDIGNMTNSAYFTFTIGYLVFITRIIQNSHSRGYEKLLKHATLSEEEKEAARLYFQDQKLAWQETLFSLGIGALHSYLAVFRFLFNGTLDFPIYYTFRGLSVIILWWVIWQAASTFIRNMTKMNILSKSIEIDLINLDKFMPLTSAGVLSILAFMGTYSLLFLQGINISDIANPAIIALIPTIFWMLLTPLKGLRKRIGLAKESEIKLLDKAIDGDKEALKQTRIGNNLDNINVVDLMTYKKLIANTFEIPVNIPTASRFVFYLIIPFLTWIAASIVDKIIDFLIA